jgi:hypothetical protein
VVEKFERYTIDFVKLVKDDTGNEIYKDATIDDADEFILMGHFTGIHGIDIAEAIFASGNLSDCANMFERITGEEYNG